MFYITWNFNSILMSLLLGSCRDFCDDTVPFLECIWNPPCESRFICYTCRLGIFSSLDWIRLFEISKCYPAIGAILPLNLEVPSLLLIQMNLVFTLLTVNKTYLIEKKDTASNKWAWKFYNAATPI